MFMCNAQSIASKFDELLLTLQTLHKTGIAIVTESWLTCDHPDVNFNLPNKNLFRSDRQGKIGGGVAIWCDPIYQPTVIPLSDFPLNSPDGIECMFLYLKLLNFVISVYYIPPGIAKNHISANKINTFIIDCFDFLHNTNPDIKICICGDFNRLDVSFMCNQLDLLNCTTQITRPKSNSTLDYFLVSNSLSHIYSSSTCVTGAPLGCSDHCSILLYSKNCTNAKIDRPIKHLVYDLRESNIDYFVHKLSIADFTPMYFLENINCKVNFFYSVLYDCVNVIPKVYVDMSNSDPKWMTPLLKHLILLTFDGMLL